MAPFSFYSCRCAGIMRPSTKDSITRFSNWINAKTSWMPTKSFANSFIFISQSRSTSTNSLLLHRIFVSKISNIFEKTFVFDNFWVNFSWFLESAEVYSPFLLIQLICNMLIVAICVFQLDLVRIFRINPWNLINCFYIWMFSAYETLGLWLSNRVSFVCCAQWNL